MAVEDRHKSKASTHVIIDWDHDGPNPLVDYDQVFLIHSNIRDFCGNENGRDYDSPLEETVDEDGYGTGEFKFRDGVVHFPVSAYIHSGIALSMGSIREFPCDPGGWDTTRNAAYMWTDKERFEKMHGPWMRVYDEKTETFRPAKDKAEFREYLWKLAKSELELFQKYMDGQCFGWREETRIPFKRVYPDGREIDDCEWEDGDSCWGYYADSIDDFEFPKDADTDVFDATDCFVGNEWTLPEFVVRSPVSGLYLMTEGSKTSDSEWVHDLSKAKVFHSRNDAYNAFLQRGKRLWEIPEYARNSGRDAIREKDELK